MIRYWKQRRIRGFDKSELYSLDMTISKFVYPRLKAFRDTIVLGVPIAFMYDIGIDTENYTDADFDRATQLWKDIITKMMVSFDPELDTFDLSEEELEEIVKIWNYSPNTITLCGNDLNLPQFVCGWFVERIGSKLNLTDHEYQFQKHTLP